MASDEMTFFIGFAVIFVGLGWYLWHLERQVAGLSQRVADARAARTQDVAGDAAGASAGGGGGGVGTARAGGGTGQAPDATGPTAGVAARPSAQNGAGRAGGGPDAANPKRSEEEAGP